MSTLIASSKAFTNSLTTDKKILPTQTFALSSNKAAGVEYVTSTSTSSQNKTKKLILIRHGLSLSNEDMDRPGNRWGDPTFIDDASLVDTLLSEKGISQAASLRHKLRHRFVIGGGSSSIRDNDGAIDNNDPNGNGDHDQSNAIQVDDNLLVVTSPLTRCIQTMNIGVLPNIVLSDNNVTVDQVDKLANNKKVSKELNSNLNLNLNVKVLVQPLARERVYTASDTGRGVKELKKLFPHLDFDTCFQEDPSVDGEKWWYTHTSDNDIDSQNNERPYEEWRPYGDGQYYAVPGEPEYVFNQRMVRLFNWIKSREEQTIILVCHWAVILWLTGEEVGNCDVKELDFDRLVLKKDALLTSSTYNW